MTHSIIIIISLEGSHACVALSSQLAVSHRYEEKNVRGNFRGKQLQRSHVVWHVISPMRAKFMVFQDSANEHEPFGRALFPD